MCDGIKISEIAAKIDKKPFYLLSESLLQTNFDQFKEALEGLDKGSFIASPHVHQMTKSLADHLRSNGSGIAVHEGIQLGMYRLGYSFDPSMLIYDGKHAMNAEFMATFRYEIPVKIGSLEDYKMANIAAKKLG